MRNEPMIADGEFTRRQGFAALLPQTLMLMRRALIVNFRIPGIIIPPLLISAFFLLIYDAQLSGVSGQFLPVGHSYLGSILPLSIVRAALGGSSIAGQTIVTDISSGYFNKLALTPVNRAALLLGPMLANALIVALQVSVIFSVGVLLGLRPATGILGFVPTMLFGVVLGVGFSGLTVGIALMTGSSSATGGASFLFFPLTFLTSTFVPNDQLTGWIRYAAALNPISYVLAAMRSLMNEGWNVNTLLIGVISAGLLFACCFSFALYGLRVRSRKI